MVVVVVVVLMVRLHEFLWSCPFLGSLFRESGGVHSMFARIASQGGDRLSPEKA
jgi:hypothetical protein